ncbi:MAG TPA: cell division protein FtsQ [Wolbachia sp.]|uniref:cell division protein FtsQ/DivIB n=1 Tax=Wolbachia endosymbiont of Pentalonia nigronervosa TaxID=1301914 RepID=UPI000EDC8544|nr:cell division protein FtsQ/DivIB [Wolbachia endosymbiont of Pentalonia nigronervosa]MBD0391549.1 FtsQ-type POTRA domain-containing protein [Wolbachia endosymbiont of Pentalonia nigronervosa]HCE59425.1 cell division protein FtsQ [Wolbachia sp.]
MLNNITRSQKRFLRRCALIITISLFLTLVTYSSLGKIISYFNYYSTQCSNLLLNSGFAIEKVTITGDKFTDQKYVLSLIDKTQPIVYVRLSKLANNIKSVNKWIKDVRVYRILPNTLHIDINEHKPFAIWRDNNKTSVVDYEGKIIVDDYPMDNLVVVTGQNALSNLKFVRDILENKTQLSEHISSFVFVGNRRWNIILTNGLTVKLPEDNPHGAWDYLNSLQNTTDFTPSNWSVIDMRIIDKIFVRR